VCSYVNSSVHPFMPHKKTPTQKPTHIGQWKKWCLGRILLKMVPKH